MGPNDGHYGSVKKQEDPETGVSGDGDDDTSGSLVVGTFWETGSQSSLIGLWVERGKPLIASRSRAEALECAFLEHFQVLLRLRSGDRSNHYAITSLQK